MQLQLDLDTLNFLRKLKARFVNMSRHVNSIAISGYNHVGKATEHLIGIQDTSPEVYITDLDQNQIFTWSDMDVHVICVPTPMLKTGNLVFDVSEIYDMIVMAGLQGFTGQTIIRSTIGPIEYDYLCEKTRMNLIVWPEFLREKHWFSDSVSSKELFFGGGQLFYDSIDFNSEPAPAALTKTFDNVSYYIQDAKIVCMIKIIRNAFIAMKSTMLYDVSETCKKLGIDYNHVSYTFENLFGTELNDIKFNDITPDVEATAKLIEQCGIPYNFAQWAKDKSNSILLDSILKDVNTL